MNWDALDDETKDKVDHDKLIEELSDEFEGDPDSVIDRLENLDLDVDDLDL